jgi:hypothetical protein
MPDVSSGAARGAGAGAGIAGRRDERVPVLRLQAGGSAVERKGPTARLVAVDWSGRASGEHRHIWVAEAVEGRLERLSTGRGRDETVAYLSELAGAGESLVVGLDFAFSLPAWWLRHRGYRSVFELWDAAGDEAEEWLSSCVPPFWGRPGRPRPAGIEHFRRTEREVAPVAGIRPKSTFQIGGAGSVGTGSLRGMAILARLRREGFSVWPFEEPVPPIVIEIYPRALTGAVRKSKRRERVRCLDEFGARVPSTLRSAAASGEDAFDAVVSALVMSEHIDELQALRAATDPVAALEGRIWLPRLR